MTFAQNGNWQNPTATVTGTIIKYGGGTVTNVTGTKAAIVDGVAGTPTAITGLPTTGGNYTISDIATDTEIIITTTDSEGKTKTHKITVILVRDTTPPVISEETATASGFNIEISAKATDSESGIASFKYEITPTTGLSKSTDDLPQDGTPVTITSTEEATYTIKLTATDNAGKTATKEITGVKTVAGIKHIKLSDGTLKAVNTKDIYGADVLGYTCGRSDVEWQIFYIDEEDDHRVYLIAKDYAVPPVNSSSVTPKLLAGGHDRWPKAYKFGTSTTDGILGSYTTAIPGKNTTTVQGKFMNKFLSEYAGYTVTSVQNLQATSYMLDQNVWSEYMSTNNKSDLVFGGPTLPLFQASYNDTCRTSTKLGIKVSGTGYQVKIGNGDFTTWVGGFGDTSTQKGIYFMGNNTNSAAGMWLASPSSGGADYVMVVACGGDEGGDGYYSTSLGFRPVVSLKSTIQFTSNTEGTVYTIAN